jgi:uncharacterized membrane protein
MAFETSYIQHVIIYLATEDAMARSFFYIFSFKVLSPQNVKLIAFSSCKNIFILVTRDNERTSPILNAKSGRRLNQRP